MNPWIRSLQIPTVFCMGLGMLACGALPDNSQLQDDPARASIRTYQEWCTQWQLTCTSNPGEIEVPTPAEWKAVNGLIHAYVSSASQFAVTRQELSDLHLQQATKILRVGDLYDRVLGRVQATDWQSIDLTAGQVRSKAGLPIADKASSGLSYHWGTDEQTRWDDKGAIYFSGLSLSGPATAPVALQNLSMADDGTMTVGLPDQTVTGVPFDTITHSLLDAVGVDLQSIKAKAIKTQEIVQAVGPLTLWLNKPSRVINLEPSFFTKAAVHVGALAPQDQTGDSLKFLVNSLQSLKTTSAAGGNLATVTAASGLKCDWDNGDVKIILAKDFGLKRSYQVNEGTYGVEFYGIQVSGKKALGLTINVKRVETDKDKITIQDVPVIGKVELKWDDVLASGENAQLLCSKS